MSTRQIQMTLAQEKQERVSVVLIRHAQSQWNRENRFTGWADPPLTDVGVSEAVRAAQELREAGFVFDTVYSSMLQRSIVTLDILLDGLAQAHLPRRQDWRLNERHYGVLQGRNKDQVIDEYGEQQVWRWRRSYREAPVGLSRDDVRHPLHNPVFAAIEPSRLPDVESLWHTRVRVMEFWYQQVVPRIKCGERLLISAHGNTLRALIMELSAINEATIEDFEIPTATPLIYSFDREASPLGWRYLAMD